jgi:hypothetical protein
MQIKTTVRLPLTPVRMAIIKAQITTQLAWMWVNLTLLHCWWKCKLVQPLWKTVWRLLEKVKIKVPYDPAILLLEINPKECKSGSNKDNYTPMNIAAILTIARLWK